MQPVLVVGGSLAGMAAAARLAKAGHPVELWEAADRLGGHLAAAPGPDGIPVDVAPAVIGFPAPWRDLFRKSGRTLEAELARTKAELAPAGPARYTFADGSTLDLPSDRGEQYTTLTAAYGASVADRWLELHDWWDDVWQAIRPLGLERELTDEAQLSRAVRALLRPDVTVADLAADFGEPRLGALLRAAAYRQGSRPDQTPAWAAVTLSVERRFGRWTVRAPAGDARNRTGRTSALVEALGDRLVTRRVEITYGRRLTAIRRAAGALVARAEDGSEARPGCIIYAADPWQLSELVGWTALRRTRWRLRGLPRAVAPRVSHSLSDQLSDPFSDPAADAVDELVRLDPDGTPTVTYRRPVGPGTLESVHDFAAGRPDPAAGVGWRGFASWFRRPPVRTELPGLLLAGPYTPAGVGLSPTVLAGALASYAAHDADRSSTGS